MRWLLIILIYLPPIGHAECRDNLELPALNYPWMTSVFELTPKVEAFLLAGERRLATETSTYGKLTAAIRYIHASLDWNAKYAAFPEPTFSLVLARGLGGCEHFAVLTAALLQRSGIDARLVVAAPGDAIGHVWLELELNNMTYILDPTTRTILSLKQASRLRATQASVSNWYLDPRRTYYDL